MRNNTPTWYILRHGLATHSMNGYGDKILSAPLLPEAVPAIERMSAYLAKVPVSSNWSSTLIRCIQTTEIVRRITGKVFIPDKRLNEFYQETFSRFYGRVSSWFKEVNTSQSKNILVCTHGVVIAALKQILLTGDFSEAANLLDYPGCGQLVVIKERKIELFDFNS